MATTSDLHVVETRPLVAPAVLHQELPMDAAALETVASARQRIQDILSGRDQRLLVVVAPVLFTTSKLPGTMPSVWLRSASA